MFISLLYNLVQAAFLSTQVCPTIQREISINISISLLTHSSVTKGIVALLSMIYCHNLPKSYLFVIQKLSEADRCVSENLPFSFLLAYIQPFLVDAFFQSSYFLLAILCATPLKFAKLSPNPKRNLNMYFH